MGEDDVKEGVYIAASDNTRKVPTAGPSNGIEVYQERHPNLFLFHQRRMIKQVENHTRYKNAMREMIDAEIEVRKSREQYEHIDKILDTVGMRIHDEHAEAQAVINENTIHRDTRLAQAKIQNRQVQEELRRVEARDAPHGDVKGEEYWDAEAQKIAAEERGKAKVERERRKVKRERISELKRELNDELNDFVREEKRSFGRDVDLKDPDSWTDEDRDIINNIRYSWEQMIADEE